MELTGGFVSVAFQRETAVYALNDFCVKLRF